MTSQWQVLMDQVTEQLRGAARFRWWALGATWLLCLAGWIAVALQPDMFGASARVYVDTRTSLGPVLQGLTINQGIEARVNLVSQSLLGRAQLEQLAKETGLDAYASTPEDKDYLIEIIRSRVRLDAWNTGGGTVYQLAYISEDRETSLKAVDFLLKAFLKETLGGKNDDTKTVKSFLKESIADYEQRLVTAEQRLADFKRRNVGQMPGAQGDYFSRLQAAMTDVDRLKSQLTIATTKRDELQRQLAGGRDEVLSTGSPIVDDSPTAKAIQDAEAKTQELLLKYTDRHPDVVSARETLAQLRQRYEQELAVSRRGAATGSTPTADPVMQKIKQALNEAEVEIAATKSELESRQSAVNELRSLVNVVPEVEAEFSRLNRDYDVTRRQHAELVERLDKADLGEQAETAEAIKFEVINPPVAGFEPEEPKRALLMAIVLVAGLGLGGALAYVLHLLKPVFHSSRALQDVTGYPVLGVVSMTWLNRYKRHMLLSYGTFSAGLLALVAMLVVVMEMQPLLYQLHERF